MGKIDTAGTYIGTVKESGVGLTKKGYPQWVARLVATKKYIETASELQHFKLEDPAFVDWSTFEEEIVGFMVLFNNAEQFSPETALMNYEQLQKATGWDGTEFDSLIDGAFVGKEILFRVKEDTYEGKTGLKVDWIDAADASPERQLKSLDASEVKSLAAKLTISKAKPAAAAAPAKPAAVAKAPVAPKPSPAASQPAPAPASGTATAGATPAATPASSATAPSEAPKAAPAPRKKKEPVAPTPPPTAPKAEPAGLPAECTMLEAWEYVCQHKGGNEDGVVEDAWLAALGEVAPNVDQTDVTAAQWGKVRDTVLKDLAIDPVAA